MKSKTGVQVVLSLLVGGLGYQRLSPVSPVQ